ncbi:MAG: hypothetical protein JXR83_12230 [Deltaproteobacteria bacterium]|nr:hypothetical protein [Deltaproteobacteria bacterium]
MSSAAEEIAPEEYLIARSGLSLEDARLCQSRLESRQVDCVIGTTRAAITSAPAPGAAVWWIKVRRDHQTAAGELLAALERLPVTLVRRDATWKYAFVASALTAPVNYLLLERTGYPPLSLALAAVAIGLAIYLGRQRAVYLCSNPQCLAANDRDSGWCCRCGAKIEAVVERPGSVASTDRDG